MKLFLISFIGLYISTFEIKDDLHPFHLSITELEVKQDTLQISLRIFTDDLEYALKEMSGEKVFLNDHSQQKRNFILIRDYLTDKFGYSNGAKSERIEWLGHEFEDDVCWIYGQVQVPPNQRILFIRNEVLTEVFDNQQNIVHFNSSVGIDTKLATKRNGEVRFSRP